MSGFLVCTTCGLVHKSNTDDGCCMKIDCVGELHIIDELMIPTVINLNRKNIIPISSCSGHSVFDTVDTYIVFFIDINSEQYQRVLNIDSKYFTISQDNYSKYKKKITIRIRGTVRDVISNYRNISLKQRMIVKLNNILFDYSKNI